MSKKWIKVASAIVLSLTMTVPVFAASPSTATVMKTPVTVHPTVIAAKGYTLSPLEQAACATTPEEATALAAGLTSEVDAVLEPGVLFGTLPTDPAVIAAAKADILKNASLQKALQKRGVAGTIVRSGTMSFSNGKTGSFSVSLNAVGLVPGEKVAILCYLPGDLKPRVVKATWKDGKLKAKLPVPCYYSIVK
ncbi:MAG: hypothetical protein K6E16_01140 [Lachnospiraceae bacterium]|nr:hypothetical protein [Lachnospiraceae bacterium]